MMQKRIVWIDDSFAEFARVNNELNTAEDSGCHLEFLNLDNVLHEDGKAIQCLLDNPPNVLLLDWNDGSVEETYSLIKGKVELIILVSWNTKEDLRSLGVFNRFPEFEENMLQKQFGAIRLIEKIEGNKLSLNNFGGKLFLDRVGWRKKGKIEFEDFLTIRYLDENLQPISTSSAWKLDQDRPILNFSLEEITAIKNGEKNQQSLFCSYPSDPERFGPVQFVTKKLPIIDNPPWDASARFFQQALPLPEKGIDLESIGSSVDGIIELMRQAGFARGRFYHLTYVSGLDNPSLELVSRFPGEVGNLPLPASKAIDSKERNAFENYCSIFERRKYNADLIFNIVEKKKGDGDDGFWSSYVNDDCIEMRLEVPIFLSSNEIDERGRKSMTDPLRVVRGLFIFDRGNKDPIKEKHVKAISPTLLSAINYFSVARRAEHERWLQKVGTHLLEFHEILGPCKTGDEVEKALIKAAREVDSFDTHGGETDKVHQLRSATYARFDPKHSFMEVMCDTDELILGFTFNLDSDFFVIAECARTAQSKKAVPIYKPDFDISVEKTNERIRRLKKIPQCTEENLKQCLERLKNVKAVAAFPVMSGDQLLGVLLLRSSHPHEFTRRRVEVLQRTVDVARPYLERFRDEANRRSSWDGLIMHEMRSNLSWAANKLDRIQHAISDEDRAQTINDLQFVLAEGISLSSMFLRWLGHGEEVDNTPTTDEFWNNLKSYGEFKARANEKYGWYFNRSENCHCKNALYFGRAMLVLIDNAFRYARDESSVISCDIQVGSKSKFIEVKIGNSCHPDVVEDLIKKLPQGNANLSMSFDMKKRIGLTLVDMLFKDMGVDIPRFELDISNKENPLVNAYFFWPSAT